MGLQFLDIPKMVCVCVQDMKQTLFVACFGARSCCFAAARCFSSRKSKAHPLYSGQRPWTDLHTYAQGRTTGVHRLDKGRSGNSPWNTGFKVLAGWEGGQTYNQLEISWKKGIGNLDAFPFLFFKKNFDSETASGSAQILSETTSWTFQRWSYHPEQDAECSRSHLIALPSHQLFQGEPPFLYQRPPLLFLNIQLCMGLQLEHIGCCPKRLRLWRGGQGWESETQVSIGTGSLGLGAPVDRKVRVVMPEWTQAKSPPSFLQNHLQATWGETTGLWEVYAWRWPFKATVDPLLERNCLRFTLHKWR